MIINNQAINKLKSAEKIAIFIHINPDGDCLGSASALKQALVSLNKQVDIFCDSPVAEQYKFIKYINEINNKTTLSYDLLVSVDCSDAKRMGEYSKMFVEHENTLEIDHHQTNEQYANVNVVEDVSSTCFIIYHYIKALEVKIDADIATALYSGIATDTGCFQHSNVTSLDHIVCAELIDCGIDLYYVNSQLFKYCTLSRFELFKTALASAKFFFEGKLGIMSITRVDLKRTKAQLSDTTGIVNSITNVNGVEIGVMIYEEKPGLFKCSFRSSGNVDVSALANKNFGGGGHKFAAGCNIFGSLNTVINKVVEACKSELEIKD